MWDGHLGRIHATKYQREQNSEEVRPVHSAPYHTGPAARQLEKSEIEKMLEMNVIELAQTEWASPIVFEPKNDWSRRFCVEYRKFNAVTIRESYSIPRMDECIDSLGDATKCSTLDANYGCWQVEIYEKYRYMTTFTYTHCLHRFIRMKFGLKNA